MTAIPVKPEYKPVEKTFSVATAVWDIQHDLGREVNVAFYDESGERIYPKEQKIDTNNYRGSFFVKGIAFPIKGKMVVS